jgi:NAD(P)-dependent dehydrogenase (short-subunit alcohol dehydrogenase family)
VTVTSSAGDVADEAAVEAAVATATEATGGLDVAVLAAGTGNAGPLLLMERAAWQAVLDTNLTGAFLSLKHAGRAMARSGGGSIVAISSIAGARTHRFMAPYCVSKGGLDTLVQNAADELGVAGIRVNSVRPGLVPTELSSALEKDDQVRGDYLDQMPVRRLGTVDDIAALVRHLAGPEGGWITGQCISVDGGHHLRRGPDLEPWMRALFGDDAAEGRV